jgi:hypothetical protein
VLVCSVTIAMPSLSARIWLYPSFDSTTLIAFGYTGFAPSKKYDSKLDRVELSGSRTMTWIWCPGWPPTAPQSVILPAKMSRTCAFVSPITGLAAFTASAVPAPVRGEIQPVDSLVGGHRPVSELRSPRPAP